MKNAFAFKRSQKFTVGIELELQLINLDTYNLIMESEDLIRRTAGVPYEANIKPEITQSMIELNSSIHDNYESLFSELLAINNQILNIAKKVNIGVCGGGVHPFQKWKEQKIFRSERFLDISDQYGYLAKQFTVFGQHIHIGCESGDDALYLCHAFAYYIPHFIALSASSPFNQSVDTSFDCSRLSIISAFPLSGTPPWIFHWEGFAAYFKKLNHLGVVKSMKDFYWDIRPKPEYGTLEIRICDTPLTIQRAADLAFYANCLARFLLDHKNEISHDIYLTYLVNRYRASRFGLEAEIIDVFHGAQKLLKDDIIHTCFQIEKYADENGSMQSIERIRRLALDNANDAKLLRGIYSSTQALEDVVRFQLESWSG